MQQKEREEAWSEGYRAALEQVKNAIRMREIGMSDCEIVKRTDLPPTILHGIIG